MNFFSEIIKKINFHSSGSKIFDYRKLELSRMSDIP